MCQRRHLQDYVNKQLDGRALTTGCTRDIAVDGPIVLMPRSQIVT